MSRSLTSAPRKTPSFLPAQKSSPAVGPARREGVALLGSQVNLRSPDADAVAKSCERVCSQLIHGLPPQTIPIDAEALLQDLDIVVRRMLLPGTIYGISYRCSDDTWLVCIATNLPAHMERWTLAHELGHILLHGHQGAHQPGLCDERDWVREVEANTFASLLLAPEDQVRQVCASAPADKWISAVAQVLGISQSAAAWRLWELGLGELPSNSRSYRKLG